MVALVNVTRPKRAFQIRLFMLPGGLASIGIALRGRQIGISISLTGIAQTMQSFAIADR
jgi:hypothetical protein